MHPDYRDVSVSRAEDELLRILDASPLCRWVSDTVADSVLATSSAANPELVMDLERVSNCTKAERGSEIRVGSTCEG